ncbi:MAG: nucleotidyltransferase family protein [Defluviitaleaceae bacterium]|nr:nucleotidyltransferase family protein [Defluviitaleaceae bacterium]
MKALILAAGYATRMYPLTKEQPKALLPLGNQPIINYIVDQLNTLPNLNEIIVISNHKFYQQFETWSTQVVSAVPISLLNDGSTNEDNRLGAIGDIRFTLQQKNIVSEDFVVIAGDNFMTYPLLEQYEFFLAKSSDTICALKLEDKQQLTQFAVATLDETNKVVSLVEKPENPPSNTAIFATYFFRKETLPLFDEYIQTGNVPDAPGYFIQWLYQKKPVYAYIMNGECHDIGTIAAYETMQKTLDLSKISKISKINALKTLKTEGA